MQERIPRGKGRRGVTLSTPYCGLELDRWGEGCLGLSSRGSVEVEVEVEGIVTQPGNIECQAVYPEYGGR